MATNPYVNKVLYGNQTVMDISGDTVTASDVASGKTFHDASGAAQTGSYVPPTITDITPDNTTPGRLTADVPVNPTTNGLAIKSLTTFSPSQFSFKTLNTSNVYKMSETAYAVGYYSDVEGSDVNPTYVRNVTYCYNGGWLYATKQTLAPTIAYTAKSNPSNTRTYTYDATKKYMIVSAYLVTTALAGANRTSVWYLDKGTLSERMGASQTDGASTVTNNTSTNTLTMAGTNASYRTEFTVIQLN